MLRRAMIPRYYCNIRNPHLQSSRGGRVFASSLTVLSPPPSPNRHGARALTLLSRYWFSSSFVGGFLGFNLTHSDQWTSLLKGTIYGIAFGPVLVPLSIVSLWRLRDSSADGVEDVDTTRPELAYNSVFHQFWQQELWDVMRVAHK